MALIDLLNIHKNYSAQNKPWRSRSDVSAINTNNMEGTTWL